MIHQELLQDLTESYLKSLIAETSGALSSEFDSLAPFGELGIDSFYVLKIIRRLETDFGTLPKSLLFEHFTISDLATYFVNNHEQVLAVRFAGQLNGNNSNAHANGHPVKVADVKVKAEQPARKQPMPLAANAAPIRITEKAAHANPELRDIVQSLFERFKRESSISRGTRIIAPNLFIGSTRRGYFNYGRCRNIVMAYGYTGPEEYFQDLLSELCAYCVSNKFQLNIMGDRELPRVGEIVFSATPFGVAQRILNLKQFTLDGGPMRRLRYQVSKFEKCGIANTQGYRCGSNPETDRKIVTIIDRWCESRTKVNPLVHEVREEILAGTLAADHRLFLTYLDDVLQNVILITPMCSDENGYLMDLEFYTPEMPLGGLEFAITRIIEVLASEGCEVLSLGATYGCKLESSANADPEIDKVLDDLRAQDIFNDTGNLQFKNKFRPENKPIFLCRPVGSGSPDDVIDIIMMIADPLKNQTPEELENRPTEPNSQVAAVVEPIKQESSAQATSVGPERKAIARFRALADFGFNSLNIPHDRVEFDLKTDSWSQLQMASIEVQMKSLNAQLQQPVDVDESLRLVFPFTYFVLTESGQASEDIFFRALPKKGITLQNLLFPSTIFHQIDKEFSSKELPSPALFDLTSRDSYKGNMDLEALRALVTQDPSAIAMVCIEVGNNAAGGAPVSLKHLKEVEALLSRYSIPLVIDGTRVVENAQFLIDQEEDCAGKSIWTVVREIFSCADAVIGSLTKDFCVSKGGIIATNDAKLFQRLETLAHESGPGIDLIDRKLIALSLRNRKQVEARVLQRMESVRMIWQALHEHGVPVVQPAGGHCVLIDVKQIPEFKSFKYPVASFVAWMYLNTGIRVAAHSVGMQKHTSINDLVRLAIPVGMKRDQIDDMIGRLLQLFDQRVNIPELLLESSVPQSFGSVHANYRLLGYHRAAEILVSSKTTGSTAGEDISGVSPALHPVPVSFKPEKLSGSGVVERSQHASTFVTKEEKPSHDGRNGRPRKTQDVAVVGMAGRYPKAKNLAELWENLREGKDCIEEIPADRYELRAKQGATKKYRGGFIGAIDKFDSLFFNISPREAAMLDPQERLFLEVAWEAIEDAGYYPEILSSEDGSRNVGVFVGAVWAMYQMFDAEEDPAGKKVPPNSFLWSIANRVSYWMNLSGPSLTLDTACSSSLTALYLACEAIQAGECSSAIVGGVNLDLHETKLDINSSGGALSKDGLCRSFGKGANGYVAGEGIGALFLKPLDQAVRDNDNIYGVIKSVAVNHGGRASGYTIPNPKAQSSLISLAIEKAQIDARSLSYIEAHGTGTELGDPIEISGLSSAFKSYAVDNQTCAIGSVKSNIGHLEAAAGVVSVSKVLLQMKHKKLAPSLHSGELNEFIDFANSPFFVVQRLEDWKGKQVDGVQAPLRAGISSFGAGGANAHVILENYEHVQNADGGQVPATGLIFPLSARTEDQLREMVIRLATAVSENCYRLMDVAYTLQVGRRSFEHRVAIHASAKEELLEKLTSFLNGKKTDGIARGQVKNSDSITRLLSRKEKQEFIQLLSQSRSPYQLAELWADGIFADWRGFESDGGCRRVSLPTYPFADKRHWAGKNSPARSLALTHAAVHPMVDTNESTFERQLFKKTFHERDFFIYDHHVADIPTLPGVAYLEFARKAGEIAAGRKVQKIRNIVWISPIAIHNATPIEVFIELKPSDATVRFEVFSYDKEGKKVPHSQGTLLYATRQEEVAEPEFIDLQAIRRRCVKVIEGKDAYPRFRSFGLGLGPSFQVLQEVHKNETEILGVLKLPDFRQHDLQSMILQPSLIDGSLQAGMGAHLGEQLGEMFVPFSIGEVEVLHPLQANCFSYATEMQGGGKTAARESTRLVKSDVMIVDETGKVLVKIRESVGVPLREIYKKTTAEADGFAKLYYSYDWEKAPLVQTNEPIVPAIVFFDTEETLRDLYRERLTKEGKSVDQVILVQPGDSFQDNGLRSYKINPRNREDYTKLFESLAESKHPLETICFAWTLHPPDLSDENNLDRTLGTGVYSFLFVCQSLIQQKLESKTRLLFLYATQQDETQPANEAVSGFIKALRVEHSKFNCRTLEVKQNSFGYDQILNAVSADLQTPGQDATAVRYDYRFDREDRLIKKLRAFNLEEASNQPSSQAVGIRENGVYLITGGAGGLGSIFAEFLAREHHAKVVLAGRSALSEAHAAKLNELTNLGAEVIYLPADVSQRGDVERLVSDTKARFGQLNGVIHAAGVLRDSLIRNKKREEMSAVFAPKIYGTLHLDEATQNENLDFFVMFSSVASVGGNAGQCDYSFANHYMDSFSASRELLRSKGSRSGKTLSLNWSLWADGGMRVDEQTELYFKKTLGIKPLTTAVGIEAFLKGLGLDLPQFAVVEGVQEKVELAWGLRKKEPVPANSVAAPAGHAAPMADGKDADLVAWLQKELSEIVMQFLKLDASDVSADKILLDLGFDSIGLTTFANTINEKYQLDITPVLFFDYPSLAEIAKYLSVERKNDLLKFYQGPAGKTDSSASAAAGLPSENPKPIENSKEETFKAGKGWNSSTVDRQVSPVTSGGGFSPELRFINQPIAIVGMSGVMPQSEDLDEFWDNLKNSKDMITVIPPDRWNWEDYYGDPLKESNKSNSKWGGFMKEIDKFDPLFFGISPREAQMMDPQQRLFLETVWRAIEDSGQKVSDLSGTKTGLFVGVANQDYVNVMNNLEVALDGYSASGNSHSVLANRISFLLNLRGPSAPIDTACSSSLVALHRAIESIHTGSSDMAIVGGVQIMLSPAGHISFGMAGMLSSDGKCKTFDKKANGYVRGEGCGAIFLKPLSVAEADGNHIYAVIRATAENHGGRVTTMTAPNSSAQAALLVEAYDKARIDATTVGYIECHGTGTSLGDPIEIQALTKAFSEMYKKRNHAPATAPHCGLSSVKTNIGHLETAAGMSSLLKVLLALKHKQIPANINFEEINPYINLKGTPFYIVEKLTPWERVTAEDGSLIPRRAGVSSFGFGGANAHIVLEEYISPERKSPAGPEQPQLIVLSAKNADRLNAYVQSLHTYLEKENAELVDLAYTLQVGRDEMLERLALVASSREDLKQKLAAILQGEAPEGCYRNNVRNAAKSQPADSSGNNTIPDLIKAKDISRLAELWVSGTKVEWPLLHTTDSPRRISAPTYPFARERCWIAGAEGKTFQVRRSQAVGDAPKLHPLIHRNISTLSSQKFGSRFTGKEFFLEEHKAGTQAILPAVAYIEMVSAAGELSGEQKIRFVRDVVWMAPLTVDDEPRDVEVSLMPVKNEVDFTVKTMHHGNATTHCRGKLGYAGSPSAPEHVNIDEIRERCSETITGKDLYSFIHTAGLNLGKSFQVVQKVHTSNSQCLAVLHLPEHLESEASQFWMHPVLLDGAVHTAVSMVKRYKDCIPWSIPYSVRDVQINGSLKDVCFAHATWGLDNIKDEKSFIRLNISFLDKNGAVLVSMKDFVAKPILQGATKVKPEEDVNRSGKADNSDFSFEPGLQSLAAVWNPVRVEPNRDNTATKAKLLLLGGNPDQLQWLQQAYPHSQLLELVPNSSADVIEKELSKYSFDELLWVAPDVRVEAIHVGGSDDLIRQQEEGVVAVFRMIKALLQSGHAARKLQWTIITSRTQRVMEGDELQAAHASVAGLVGSLAKEYPQWDLRLLDIDSLASVSAQECLSLPWDKQGNGLAYRSGEWFQQGLALMPHMPQGRSVYRQNGIYVVIGGAGGVGEVWSRFMIENFRARLVWIGRRECNAAIQQKINAMAKIGNAPLYVAADATDAVSLEQALETIQKTYPAIHGVVHSAIVLNDQSIARMDEAGFRSSLSAKVDTSVNMDRVFGKQPLDFMLFFSSIVSFVRSPGQSNYSAGCTFKDSFALQLQRLKPYPVKIMNWGYWGSVGVVADQSHNELMRRMGIGSIEASEGMVALQELVNSEVTQMALIKTLNSQATAALRLSEAITYFPEAGPSVMPAVRAAMAQRIPVRTVDVLEQELPSAEMSALATDIFAASLKSLGLFSDGLHTLAGLKLEKNPAPYYERWLASSIHYLQEQSVLADDWTFKREIGNLSDLWAEWENKKTVWAANPNLQAQIALFEACLRALPGILSGKQRATDAIFPNSSMRLVEGIYRGNVLADHFNDALSDTLTACIEQHLSADKNGKVRIIEIGAGTGGTTTKLLLALKRFPIEEYCYTDISKAFLMYAEKHFKPEFPALTTSIFDVSRPVSAQAITAGHYDVAIAANVLHATPNIRETLRNAKAVLKNQGVLLLNEISTWSLFNHLTFGLLEGWWLNEDTALRLPGSPGLSTDKWQQVLKEEGFETVFFPLMDAHKLGQQIVIASSNGWVRQALVRKASSPPTVTVKTTGLKGDAVAASTHHVATNSSQSMELAEQPRVNSVKRVLIEKLSAALKIDAGRISHDAPVAEYGVDSIIGVDLIRTINETLQIELETMALFEHSTVDQLARYIATTWPSVFASQRPQVQSSFQTSVSQARSRDESNEIPAPRFQKNETPAGTKEQASQKPDDGCEDDVEKSGIEPIAIIGMSGRFAGSESLDEFWKNLEQGKSLIGKVSRWSEKDCVTDESAGSEYCSHGSFIDSIDQFDPSFFRIPPAEAVYMDPQQRLFLEESWKALEDAGYAGNSVNETRCGIYVGCGTSGYGTLLAGELPAHAFWGNSQSIIPARLAYHLNLQGPAIAVDTACSSSLVSVHLACQGLWSREMDMALAGGICLHTTPAFYHVANRAHMLSPDGECRSFDATANGFVPGEGIGVVVLKRLREALRDGDSIHGVIAGSGINQDGTSNGLIAPNARAQEKLERSVYDRFKINPESIQVIEAHGTGTIVGDSIECLAISRAFSQYTDKKQFCALGTVKTNIGHTGPASGVAGILKLLLAIRHRQIPPSLHFQNGNPAIDFQSNAFYVNAQLKDWTVEDSQVRRGAVSSFGFSGTNAHLIIEEPPAAEQGSVTLPGYMVMLSARTAEQLQQQARNLAGHLKQTTDVSMNDLSFSLFVGRMHFNHRMACVARSQAELVQMLEQWIETGTAITVYSGEISEGRVRENPSLKKFGNYCISECQGTIEAAAYLENLTAVAELYVKGYALDYRSLFPVGSRRMSLPTYPFARERYWIDSDAAPQPATTIKIILPAHPANAPVANYKEAVTEAAMETRWLFSTEPYPVTNGNGAQIVLMDAEEKIELFLKQETALQLRKPIETVAPNVSYFDLGLSSLGITTLVHKLNGLLNESLNPSALFEYRDIQSLAAYLATSYPAKIDALTAIRTVRCVPLSDVAIHEETEVKPATAENGVLVSDEVWWEEVSLNDGYEKVTF